MRLYALKVPPTVSEDTFDRLLYHLPERAQDRVRRFRHPEDAIRSIAGRLLPTWYLRRSGLVPPPTHPVFSHGPRGKPFLASPAVPGLDFNTSHEGAYVILGVVRGSGEGPADVGVDVMDLPEDPDDLEEGISYQLTTHERLQLAAARGAIKAKLLTTLWTVKEGYTKATGDGVAFGLHRIAVDLGDGRVAGVTIDGRDARLDGWQWAVGSLEAGSVGWAVIWRGDEGDEGGAAHEEGGGGEGGQGGAGARQANGGSTGQGLVEVEEVRWDEFVRAFIGSG